MEAITEVLPRHPFFVGDHADTFYVVLSGCIDLRIHRRVGRSLVLDTVKGGDVVGWSWLIPPHKWMFDAIAVQDTELLAFDGGSLRRTCDDDPAFGYAFLTRVTQVMNERLEAARKQLVLGLHGGPDGCC